jgi:LuxR family transcriptional regulator, maltose regulon positive regulatory protein
MTDQDQTLLQTKLHRPRLPHNLIVRSRLVEWLNRGIDHPLTLVCAPAGFGKTTLVGTWLEKMSAGEGGKAILPSAWLSLDENDSDLNLFLRYFIAALRTIFKEACAKTLVLLQATRQPPLAVLYTTLSNELAELPGEALLVLDDYHTIRGVEVHNLFSELARHWPKPLHLVLISRTNPPMPLSSLRASEMLGEIRGQDLRFTPEETAAYLSQAQLAPLSQSALQILDQRFEGWPAGLHLAALSLRSAASQDSALLALSGENTNITEYLWDEVLTHQVPAIHTFLLKTSILERFSASLCEAVIGETDPAWNVRACLDWIERTELFIISLDDRQVWYRYHHLFQKLLQQRLSAETTPDQVANLHRLASAWFEAHGLIDEALHQALAAGDLDMAAHQMTAGYCDVLNREDWRTLERWLHLLPEEMIKEHPELLIIRAWILNFLWRIDLQVQVVQQAAELLDSEFGASLSAKDLQILRGQILMLRAQFAYFGNEVSEALALSKEALELLPTSWTFARGAAMLYLGLSMQANGQIQAAERLLLDEYTSCADKTDIYPLIILQTLGYIYLWTGQLEKAKQIGQLLIQGATRSGILIMKNWGDYYLGMAHYQCNDLEAACLYFTQILENRYTAHGSAYRDAVAGLALIHQIRGESEEDWRLVELISQFDLEQSGSEDSRTRSLRARLMLLHGDLNGASEWVDTFNDPPPNQPVIWLEEPQVTRAHILVANGTDADLRQAQQILDVLDEIADRTHNTRYKIEILALRAMALDTQGKTNQANDVLDQALELARVGGFIRIFADLGKPMQKMLRRKTRQDRSAELIQRILAAFPDEDKNPASSTRQLSISASALVEPLTPRELEVLSLLREPLDNKAIALKLNISYATVRRHTINIYGKLGVSRRYEAVSRAIELGILPPD